MDQQTLTTAPPTNAASPGLMRFGNDIVVNTPGQQSGAGSQQNYSVLDSSAARADYFNKMSFADQQALGVQQQDIANRLKADAEAQKNTDNSIISADKAKTDSLNKATSALTGETPTIESNLKADQNLLADSQKAYDDMKTSISNITSGVTPLTADQQAQYTALQNQFDLLRKSQEQFNKAYEGGVTTLGVRSGINRYAGMEQTNRIKTAVDQGVQKIAEIDSKAASALAELKAGFISNNIKTVESAYNAYTKFVENKTKTIKDMNDAIATEAKAVAEAGKQVIASRQKQQEFLAKYDVQQPFYLQGGYLFNSIDGSPITDPKIAKSLGVADDLSNVQTLDTADHSTAFKEWKDYQSTGGKLGFNDFQTLDANRKRSTTIINMGEDSTKEIAGVKAIIDATPGEYGSAADKIDKKFGEGTAKRYDALLKTTYLLPGRARELANDARISKMTTNQKKELRDKFIQDNSYVNPEEAAKAFDAVVGKIGSGRNS